MTTLLPRARGLDVAGLHRVLPLCVHGAERAATFLGSTFCIHQNLR